MCIALLAPLGGFLVTWLMPGQAVRLATGTMAISFLAALWLAITTWNTVTHVTLPWFTAGTEVLTLDFAIDNRSLLMLVVVSFISLMVHIYSAVYMRGDTGFARYYAMLGFFTFSMQGIVVTDNLLLLFVFWELVGFSSYALIGHWHTKRSAGAAATKAFLLNRIGDIGFLIGLMIVWRTQGTFTLTDALSFPITSGWQTAAALCLFGGVIGKSAQFPLFTWLPDAMEGPTPVSALIHAATMVAAGVFLLIKIFPLFTETALVVVAVTGMITSLIGALAAMSQYDLKRILAYSTMSQLGLMILALGMGVVDGAFLHLLTHAFFKACLFLAAGIVIHALAHAQQPHFDFDAQDVRNMGGLRKMLPTAFVAFLLGGASLAGIPFFSGFLSKEAMLVALFTHASALSWLMIVVVLSVSFLTVLYTYRMIALVFLGEPRTVKTINVHEVETGMRIPTLILAACSLWLIVSWNPFDFKGWMHHTGHAGPHELWLTIISVLWVFAALFLARMIFGKRTPETNSLLRNAFYIDTAYSALAEKFTQANERVTSFTEQRIIDQTLHGIVYFQVIIAHITGWVDKHIVDGIVNGTVRVTGWTGQAARSIQGGNVQLYIFWAIFTIIIFIIWALN